MTDTIKRIKRRPGLWAVWCDGNNRLVGSRWTYDDAKALAMDMANNNPGKRFYVSVAVDYTIADQCQEARGDA